MAITTNRLIELAITGDPTAALIGATWSFSGGDLLTEVDAAMDAGVTGTTGIMQPGDLIDLDGNGTYEGTYQGRFNYTGSTFHLGDGSTVSGTINIIEVTVGGTSHYYMMVNDSLAADLDGKNLSSVTFGSSFATSPNTDGFNFDDATSYELVCFARGTMIATDRGERPVEDLVAGDRVLTRDNGYQVIRWTGSRVVPARGRFAPVVFLADPVGNTKTMRLSQQHRVRLGGALVELNFGCSSVLAPAQALVNGHNVFREEGGEIEYFHILLDRHEIVQSDGAWTESFLPTARTLSVQDAATRNEILDLFPELDNGDAPHGDTARTCLKSWEARILAPDIAAAPGEFSFV